MSLSEPRDVAIIRQLAGEARIEQLSGSWASAPSPTQPIVISVMRNERARIGDFLHHYRLLGVRHFAIIDNGSNDGTRDYLAAEPDVRLFAADGGFDWRRKHGWIMHLVERLGRERWYLLCDADEHCVFAGSERAPLSSLVAHLEGQGRRRARGALVDMYREGPMAAWSRPPDVPLRTHYPLFDAGTYREHRNALLTSRSGGPRQRVMGHLDPEFRPELTKYPLFRLGAEDVAYNPHVVWPAAAEADDPCLIGILHYKFDTDLFERLNDAVASRQYWNASAEYRVYLEALRANPELGFLSGASRRYETPDDLLKFGVIEGIQTAMSASPGDRILHLAECISTAARIRRAEALRSRRSESIATMAVGPVDALNG